MTFSIVAWDGQQLGVAASSHWFALGPVVCWAEAGVGAVATQATADPSYGPKVLGLLRAGFAPDEVLGRLVGGDPHGELRQVGVVDATGRVAVHTGARCIPHAGHATGAGVAAQTNIAAHPGLPERMVDAFLGADGDLAARLLVALAAGEAHGGDLRGRQSAALRVVDAGVPSAPWPQRMVDLRVDDHPDPVGELRRLLALWRAYQQAEEAEELLDDDPAAALERYRAVADATPELRFWCAVATARAGHIEDARRLLAGLDPDPWAELWQRVSAAGYLDATAAELGG